MIRAALTLLVSIACQSCPAATQAFDRFVATFVLEAFGTTVGRSEWRLVPAEGGEFVWESRSEAAGAGALFHEVQVMERSRSELHGRSFRPLEYRYDRVAEDAVRTVRVRFDWRNGVALNTAEGHTWRMPVPPGTLDKLSYLLALMQDLSAGRKSLTYTIADGGRLKTYDMREAGTEILETALGALETVRVRRLRREEYGEATLWCAPALGYLPVKLENRDRDGRLVSMHIQSIEGAPPRFTRRPGG